MIKTPLLITVCLIAWCSSIVVAFADDNVNFNVGIQNLLCKNVASGDAICTSPKCVAAVTGSGKAECVGDSCLCAATQSGAATCKGPQCYFAYSKTGSATCIGPSCLVAISDTGDATCSGKSCACAIASPGRASCSGGLCYKTQSTGCQVLRDLYTTDACTALCDDRDKDN